jgi:hypothetical protein
MSRSAAAPDPSDALDGDRQFTRWPREVPRGEAVRAKAARDDSDRHLAAVTRSLGWAAESAARGDYADALGWLRVIEAIGDEVSHEYQAKRREWRAALAESRARPGDGDGMDRDVAPPARPGMIA